MVDLNHILLFKTNISSESCKDKLRKVLDGFAGIERWNIALDDQDCVLRVISSTLNHHQIISLINLHGYNCCELT